VFTVAPAYEAYMGRWSRPVAREFVRWLEVPARRRWLDVGCGTGALTEVVVEIGEARSVVGVDPSAGFVQHALARSFETAEVQFLQGDALALPVGSVDFDVVVSGLVLNFVPEPGRMIAEMVRAARPGGTIGLYVWDMSSGGMELIARFWEVATAVDPAAAVPEEVRRFKELCAPEPLAALLTDAGLSEVIGRPIDIPMVFRDFDDYWTPFLGGQGPAGGYLASRSATQQEAIREELRTRLAPGPDDSIHLKARAWAVRGTKPA
jgi:SAM-dependent methyltransferase